MEWFGEDRRLELTERNVNALLQKLDDPQSMRTILAPGGRLAVRAVEAVDFETAAEELVHGTVLVTRAQLEKLVIEGETVRVGDVTLVSVADAAHYSDRPSGQVHMPSVNTTQPSNIDHWRFPHICEVCGTEELLTHVEAFDAGWDYPPERGKFGVISPRCCPKCPNSRTLWWAMAVEKYTRDMLSETHLQTAQRILAEPEDLELPDHMRP